MEARSGCRIGVVGGAHDDRARASTAGITRIHPGPPPITQDAAKPTQPTTGWGTPHTLLGAESVDHVEPHKDSSRFPHIRFPHGRSRPAHAPCTARTWHLLYGAHVASLVWRARGIHGSCTARTGGRLRPHGARPVQGRSSCGEGRPLERRPVTRLLRDTTVRAVLRRRSFTRGATAVRSGHADGRGPCGGGPCGRRRPPARWRIVRWRAIRVAGHTGGGPYGWRAVPVAGRTGGGPYRWRAVPVAGRTGGGPYRWRAVRVAGRARWARVLRGGRGPCGWRGPFG